MSVPYVCFFAGNIAILGAYKYTSFVLSTIVHLPMFRMVDGGILPFIAAPVGVSFMIFQTCTYLGDVHHGKIMSEHNIIRYAAYVSFFPTVLSGPIQKARDLLPQISKPAAFDADWFITGMLYFLWGVFEKICIATQLSILVGDPPEGITAGASWYLLSAIAFSIYIYADFSGYSDMAIGIARMLGIRLERNFNNPYLSRSLSEFWTRWHISLNVWLVEYVYIPLGGNRKGKIRKYLNVMVVFLLSGLWHGASWHYVIWGGANGALVVLEQVLRPVGIRLANSLGFCKETVSLRYVQRGLVCLLIGGTWLFFAHGVTDAVNMIMAMATSPIALYCNTALWDVYGSVSKTAFVILLVIVFVMVQCRRNGRSRFTIGFHRQPLIVQWGVLGVMLTICLFVYCSGYTTVNTEFIYFQF